MKELQEMLDRTTSKIEYDRMIQSLKPLFDYFGMGYMYYVAHHASGGFSVTSTNIDALSYFFENIEETMSCPVINKSVIPCHDPIKLGVGFGTGKEKWSFNLLHNTPNQTYLNYLERAENRYNCYLSINISRTTPQGTVSYGFGVKNRDRRMDEYLVNHLPLLYRFYDYYEEENHKFLCIASENRIFLNSPTNPSPSSVSIDLIPNIEKQMNLLKQFGLGAIETLTPRELEILKHVSKGYSAHYIGKELFVSTRTVENHIANIKSKLNVSCKLDLINKMQGLNSIIS